MTTKTRAKKKQPHIVIYCPTCLARIVQYTIPTPGAVRYIQCPKCGDTVGFELELFVEDGC